MIGIQMLFFVIIGKTQAGTPADNYMDSIIGEPLEKAIQDMGLDPAPLPDFFIPFQFNIGPIPIVGRVDYTNGIFNGLSKIRRLADCDGPILSVNEIKFECILNLFGMSTVYDGKAKINELPPIPFQVTAYVNETYVKNGIAGQPASLKGQIKAFEITKFGDINARLSGLGIFQPIYNAVEERFRERVKEELTKIIIEQFPTAFKMAMSQFPLPGVG